MPQIFLKSRASGRLLIFSTPVFSAIYGYAKTALKKEPQMHFLTSLSN